jgi:ankyrin repeat protein
VVYHLLKHPDTETNTPDKQGRNLIAVAAYKGHEEVVEQLLKKGININSRDRSSKTALSLAV